MNALRTTWPLLGVLTAFCSACAAPPPGTDRAKLGEIEGQYAGYKQEFADVPEYDAETLVEMAPVAELPVFVDVREPEEQAVSMIPGAMTQEEFEAHKEEYKDREIITYCTIGYRSGLYAAQLRKEGFNAGNLKGSVLSWAHAGGEFWDAEGNPTKRVHVYGEEWNLLPEDYEAVW